MDQSFDLEGNGDGQKTYEARIHNTPCNKNCDHQDNFFDDHFANQKAKRSKTVTKKRSGQKLAEEAEFDDSDDYYKKLAGDTNVSPTKGLFDL